VKADRVVVELEDGSARTLPVVERVILASLDKDAQLRQITAYEGDRQVTTWRKAPVG
jgi:hypothetical protein